MLPGGLVPQASSSDLQDAVARALGADGALAAIDPNHAERAVQREMALAVAAAIEDREALVVVCAQASTLASARTAKRSGRCASWRARPSRCRHR